MRSASDATAHPTSGADYIRASAPMAPAVALMRRLRFSAKAWLVAATFIAPIAVLATSYALGQQGTLHDTQAERDGVTYLRAVLPALRQARALRHAAIAAAAASTPMAASTGQALDEAVASLRRVDARLGPALSTQDALGELAKAQAAASGAASTEQVFATRTAVVDALLGLTGRVLDTSGLILDPQLETYYLMDASLVAAPSLLERTARLHDRLASAPAEAATPAGQAGLALGRDEGLAQSLEDELRNDFGKVIGVDAAAKAMLDRPAAFAAVDTVRDIATGQGTDTGAERLHRLDAAAAAADEGLEGLQQAALDHLDQLLRERADDVRRGTLLTFAMVAVCLAAAAYLFRAFSLVMGQGLREVQLHLSAIREGDLTTRLAPRGADEPAELLHALGDMQGALRGIVAEVRRGADHVAQASGQIAAGAQDLSGRTGRTASHVERSAASIEQITTTVRQTADHAESARRIAEGNAATATRGGEVVAEMATTMSEIRDSSGRIADILGVIDGIAFQTNILALNAAVEAARAGESGRGFSVVASEVRALAQRCAEAAREIKSLIAVSVEKVAAGAEVVRAAGGTMQEIVGGSQEVQRLLDEIARAAREQAAGVEEVGRGVVELDRGTQDNSALVEQTAAAAAALEDQARALLGQVERFRVASS
jgi:methyl-accepting chemotaxis protein